MADQKDAQTGGNQFAEDPDKQSPATPAPTGQAQTFMTPEEVENHADKGHYDVTQGVKVAHAKVPTFLKGVYALLAVWALYYMLAAKPVNDRTEASPNAAPTAEAGADTFSVTCAGCHNPTDVRKIGPGLKGVSKRLGDKELDNVLHNGRPQKGMPAPPSLNLSEGQIQSLKLYLESLK